MSNFNVPFAVTDRKSRQNLVRMQNKINNFDLVDIYKLP